jgi:hypothetical protein
MENMKNKKIIGVVTILIVMLLSCFWFLKDKDSNKKESFENTTEKQETIIESKDEFKYDGKEGIDALTLLKEKTAVEQDKSGMVVSINGRKTETEKREFWGFYVNGEMAQVGSADFKTKDTDVINWKIENY